MKPYEVEFLQEALDDLEEIIIYLAERSSTAALNMHDTIIAKAEDLKIFPKRGRPVPNKKMNAAGYRMLGIKPYILFYRLLGNTIFIYRVLHGASNYPMLYDKMSSSTHED